MGPLVALVALVAAMAAILIAYSASPAHAAGTCTTTARTTTCTYGPTGAEDTFLVPDGVSEVQIVAIGAPGAVGLNSSPVPRAGRGAQVSGDLPVTPGQTLYVNVGGAPTFSNTPTRSCVQRDHTFIACAGGFNGGGSSQWGGGGGGASDVRTLSRSGDQVESLHSRLIVAAGGGGSGGGCVLNSRFSGGAGGDATEGAGDGQTCVPVTTTPPANVFGGGHGGLPAFDGPAFGLPPGCCAGLGGSGSLGRGQDGSLGQGGNGGGSPSQLEQFGGGGGGGLFGGGGGGYGNDPRFPPTGTGGGGGGGSNLVPTGGKATITNSGPSVTISYQVGFGAPLPPGLEDKQACKKGGYEQFGFKNQGQCIKAVNANN
jgi:hypothetical protein